MDDPTGGSIGQEGSTSAAAANMAAAHSIMDATTSTQATAHAAINTTVAAAAAAAAATENNSNDVAYDLRLQEELRVVRCIRLTMTSFLHVLERARDDLVVLGDKMDRVRISSEHCRTALMQQQEFLNEKEKEQAHDEPAKMGKRKRGHS